MTGARMLRTIFPLRLYCTTFPLKEHEKSVNEVLKLSGENMKFF